MKWSQLGIRAKIAATLTVVVMLPLLIVLVGVVTRWSEARRDSVTRSLLSLATVEARVLSVSMVKDIQSLQMELLNPGVVSHLAESPALSPERQTELDRVWPTLTPESPVLSAFLNHPIVPYLRRIERSDRRVLQCFVTDQHGQLVAATSKTDDFFQADEEWWRQAYNNGKGQVVISPVELDPAVKKYTLQVSLPVFDQDTVVGVAKFKFDLGTWISSSGGSYNQLGAQPMLVRDDGTIVYRPGETPLSHKVEGYVAIVRERRIDSTVNDGEIQAYVPISLEEKIGGVPAKMPRMSLFMYMPEAPIMAPMHRVAAIAFASGLAIILLLFLAGLFMVNRMIVRRIRMLEAAARVVAAGDFSGRAQPSKHWLGFPDEIDDLVRDFNEMASQVERKHRDLLAANELKSKFIQIASHELRTPVTYILGAIKMLRNNRDPDRLWNAMTSISTRARRLDDIIHDMFKLLPNEVSPQPLRDEDVSLQELMEEVYLECFPFIEGRGQKLKIDVGPNVPVIRADRYKVRDVVENLAMNAIKFTPDKGQVTITVRSELNDAVSIAVTDQGTGIPEKDLPYMFQPFYSGGDVLQHSSGESGYQKKGIGLGLAIVRHFVELHGGTVSVSSGPTGCTFTVILPVRRPAALAPHPDFTI